MKKRRTKLSAKGKQWIVFMAVLMLMTAPCVIRQTEAQVFILSEEEFNNSNRATPAGGVVPLLPQGMEDDWYPMPLGEGVWLLAGFGGAYLLRKGRKKRE